MAQPSKPPLRSVTEFASEQAELLKHVFDQDNDEFASLSVIKLQEEVGEVAEAFLALRSVQRQDKLQKSPAEMRESLGKEIGDVVIVIALLADAVGLRFDQVLLKRMDDIVARREKLLAGVQKLNGNRSYSQDLLAPEPADQVQLNLFARS
jgi:NTP pyrophosphatase (non-canonical NTP hydrolase)